MTAAHTVTQRTSSPTGASLRRSEMKTIAQHASTVLVGQLALMAYGVTDTIVAGRHSNEALAALSVGVAVYISVFVALMSVIQALMPVWAELHGAGHKTQLGASFRQALYLCAIVTAVGLVPLLFSGPLLRWTRVPVDLQPVVQGYLQVLAWMLPAALLFRMVSTLNQSLGQPQLVMRLLVGSLVLKVPLSIWFAFGGLGLAGHGAAGCAMASVVVQWALLAIAAWMLARHPMYAPYAIWRLPEPPSWPQIGQFARLGLPSAMTMLVEVTSFAWMALFIARLGAVPTASHQIASNLTALCFMVPLAISIAASSRVSYWIGAGQFAQARQAMRLGLAAVLACGAALSLTLLTARGWLLPVYSKDPEIIAMGVVLVAWVAAYTFFDGLQAVMLFMLRCFRVTLLPFVIYGFFLWGGGLGLGYLLAYEGLGPWAAMQHPVAFWITSVAGLAAVALTCGMLLRRVSRQALSAA
jgi:multidrug resistance protein, MATE family